MILRKLFIPLLFIPLVISSCSTSQGSSSNDSSTTSSDSSVDLRFTITFDGDGGTLVSGSEIQKVNSASEIVAPVYEKEGYKFDRWDKDITSITSDATVKAKWKQKTGTELEIDNFTSESNTELFGKVNPNVESLSFIDIVHVESGSTWKIFLDKQGTQEIATKTVDLVVGDNVYYFLITSSKGDMLLYTVTVKRLQSFTVTFATSGGGYYPNQTVLEGDYAIRPDNDPEKTGYTFVDWNYNFENPITHNTTITAQYNANKYLINYDVNGGEELESNTQEIYYNSNYVLVEPNWNGHTFLGWYDGSTQFNNGKWLYTNDKNLKANWELTEYTISYDLDGGVNSASNPDIYTIETGIINLANPTKDGFEFIGWFDNEYYSGDPILTINPNTLSNINLYAKWKFTNDQLNFKFRVNGPNSVSIYGLYDNSVEEIIIPSQVTNGLGTFNVDSIDKGAFSKCENIRSITIPYVGGSSSENQFLGYVFGANSYTSSSTYLPSSLETIIVSEGCEAIPYNSFYDCASVQSIIIPDSVQTIGASAFSGCAALKSLTVPFIGQSRDAETEHLKFGYVFGTRNYNGSTKVGDYYVPSHFEDLIVTDLDTSSNISYTYTNRCNINGFTMLKHLTITGGYPVIRFFIAGCTSLTTIVVPDSTISIVGIPTDSPLEYVEYSNAYYISSVSNPYFALRQASDLTLTSYDIHPSTKIICEGAFGGCTSMTSITIPESVVTIEGAAFSGCSSLTSITIPETVLRVGQQAFQYCTGLTYFEVPNGWTTLGSNTFQHCSSLSYLIIPDTVTQIGNSTFTDCNNITKVYYYGEKPYSSHIVVSTGGNGSLTSASWYYYTENGASETAKGRWWYYDTDGVTIREKVKLS